MEISAPPVPLPVEPPPLPEPRFTLGAASWVVFGVTAVTTLLLSAHRRASEPVGVVAQVGSLAFAFLFAMALAWLAWRLDSRRRGGGLVFCFVMLLFLAGKLVAPVVAGANAARRGAQLRAMQRESVAQQERELTRRDNGTTQKAGETKTDSDRLQERAQVFRDASQEAQGDDRRMLEVDARIIGAFQADMKAYEAAVAALRADGYISGVGLDTRAGLAKRKALIQECTRTNAALAESCRTLGDRFHAEMRRVLPEPRATEDADRAMRGFETALLLRVRDSEGLMIEAADGIVTLFDRQFDRWHFNAAKRVVFDDADAPASYARWIKQIQDAEREEKSVQWELVARAKTRLGK